MELILFALFYVWLMRRMHMPQARKRAHLRLGNLPQHIHGPYRR